MRAERCDLRAAEDGARELARAKLPLAVLRASDGKDSDARDVLHLACAAGPGTQRLVVGRRVDSKNQKACAHRCFRNLWVGA